jgi:hypothetical protein
VIADSPELQRYKLATDASQQAGLARAALGGYVGLDHPEHPDRWRPARRAELAAADAEVLRTSRELRVARQAFLNS